MRATLAALIMAPVALGPGLQAQVDYNARVGVTWATPLTRDIIIDEIEVKQKLAPTLAVGAALAITPQYQAGLELTLTSSGYQATGTGASADLGTLRTGSVSLGLHGPIFPSLRWRVGAGLLRYWPADRQSIFLEGGTSRFLAGAGMDYRRPVLPNWDIMVALRYDYHRFTTGELQTRGFSQTQGVQRISATVGVAPRSR